MRGYRYLLLTFTILAVWQWHGETFAQESSLPVLKCQVSWIGNSIGGREGRKPNGDDHGTAHVQMDVDAIWVSPDGKVYCNTPADEAHLQGGVYQDGKLIWSIDIPWGRGGLAITGNDNSIYAANSRGVVRYNRKTGRSNGWSALEQSFVTGLYCVGPRLYVSDYTQNAVVIFHNHREERRFNVTRPGAIAVDSRGHIWVAQYEDLRNLKDNKLGNDRNKVLHFNSEGKSLDPIELSKESRPTALAIDSEGRLLVADNGPDQQVKRFKDITKKPIQIEAFGEKGGVLAKPSGRAGPRRFFGLCGVGSDADGNIYVAYNGQGLAAGSLTKTHNDASVGGTVLASYQPDGTVRWTLYGLLFCDCADFDPTSDGKTIYSGRHRFTMDYSKPSGGQWKLAAYTIDPFRFPDDARLTSDNTNRGTAFVRRIRGQLFLYTIGMYAHELHLFRFNSSSETAIPCGQVGKSIWYDANGDGQQTDSEVADAKLAAWAMQVDSRGDLWTVTDQINHLPLRGIDTRGVPEYRVADVEKVPLPSPFKGARRIEYRPEEDALYLVGYTEEHPFDNAYWKEAGRVLARYDRWSKGNRKPTWTLQLLWSTKNTAYATPHGLAFTRNYAFISYFHRGGSVFFDVIDLSNGKHIGRLLPEGLGGTNKIGDSDMPYPIRAYCRADGQYLILVEDNRNAKNLLLRWKP